MITDNKDIYCWYCGIKLLPEEALDYPTKTGMIRFYCVKCYQKKVEVIEV